MPNEGASEQRVPGRIFAGDRQLIKRAAKGEEDGAAAECCERRRHQHRTGAQPLQRVDDGERSAAGNDPE